MPALNLPSIFLKPKRSVLSDQSGLTGIRLNLLFSAVAPRAFANNSIILLLHVPDILLKITNGFVFNEIYRFLINCLSYENPSFLIKS